MKTRVTVRELRTALFDVVDQDAELVIWTDRGERVPLVIEPPADGVARPRLIALSRDERRHVYVLHTEPSDR